MSTVSKSNIPVILLFGPTAVGKTGLIQRVFQEGFEIVNADSQQVYRYLQIGTAKPSADILERIPHHLIDFLSPKMQFNVASFVREADRAIVNIRRRGKVPVISGGTGYYLYHFLYGIPPAPKSDDTMREHLINRLKTAGRDSLWNELMQVDPVSAENLHPNDTQRILRALEVYHASGRPLSDYKINTTPRTKYRFLTIGLSRSREELYRRIDRRVEEMWRAGLRNEFSRLLEMGFCESDPGMRGIGYREFFLMRKSGEYTLSGVKEEIKKNSRRYAKRQITFFKRVPGTIWLHPEQEQELRRRISEFLYLI